MGGLLAVLKRVLGSMSLFPVACTEEEILGVATRLRISFYDACYVHRAKQLGAPLVTDDLRLIARASRLVDARQTEEVLSKAQP